MILSQAVLILTYILLRSIVPSPGLQNCSKNCLLKSSQVASGEILSFNLASRISRILHRNHHQFSTTKTC